jgi:hypothetical protein
MAIFPLISIVLFAQAGLSFQTGTGSCPRTWHAQQFAHRKLIWRLRPQTHIFRLERRAGGHMRPTGFQKVAYAALLVLMFGVTTGMFGGL